MRAKAHFYDSTVPLGSGPVTARCGAVIEKPVAVWVTEHGDSGRILASGYVETPYTWGLCSKCRREERPVIEGRFYQYGIVSGQDEKNKRAGMNDQEEPIGKHREAA